jgi:predicted DNA-binding transcriptional regulator YafY
MEMCEAIQGRHPISFHYENEKKGKRTVHPYAFGKTRANHDAIRAYLKHGVSYSNDEPPWRLYRLDRMRNVRVHKKTFRKRPYHGDKALRILCRG